MSTLPYKLLSPRPIFAVDMSDSERLAMREHVAYWTELSQRGTAIVFGPVNDT